MKLYASSDGNEGVSELEDNKKKIRCPTLTVKDNTLSIRAKSETIIRKSMVTSLGQGLLSSFFALVGSSKPLLIS